MAEPVSVGCLLNFSVYYREKFLLNLIASLMKFFVGLHNPSQAVHFDRACVSINRLTRNKSYSAPPPQPRAEWLLDSGAFTQVTRHGRFMMKERTYAELIRRYWIAGESGLYGGRLAAAATQDYMCAPFALEKTGLTLEDHQRLTVERFDAIAHHLDVDAHLMPVLQGQTPAQYAEHLAMYGDRIASGSWVGVGSICKRNSEPGDVLAILEAIHAANPSIRLHGFGIKKTALKLPRICHLLYSSDSMAWSFAAFREKRSANDWRLAKEYAEQIDVIVANNLEAAE